MSTWGEGEGNGKPNILFSLPGVKEGTGERRNKPREEKGQERGTEIGEKDGRSAPRLLQSASLS